MGLLLYLRLRIITFFLRLHRALTQNNPTANPDPVLLIPSCDRHRTIKAHVYRPPNGPYPSLVLLNFHGSGFIVPLHGSDNFYCLYISQNTPYTVLDIQYRLSPENPFPSPLHHIEDVTRYVQLLPKEFNSSRLSISDFSAGANLSHSSSSMMLPRDTFRHVIAFYPPADLANAPETKTAPDPTGGRTPPWMGKVFDRSCFQANDPRDPRISPFYAPVENFPQNVLIVTPARDYLADEGATLAERIKNKCHGNYVVHKRIDGCGHAWDKRIEVGSLEEKIPLEAYAAAVETLSR